MKSRRCFVLVDWWGQVRSQFLKYKHAPAGRNSEVALRNVEGIVERRLRIENCQPNRWEIVFRLYAGWMRGGASTEVLLDYDALRKGYASRRRNGNDLRTVMFLPASIGLHRGDRILADASGKRLEKKLGVHFPFTSRSECACQLCQHLGRRSPDGFQCDRIMEKQVDSSIVADTITLSIDTEKAKVIIVSNDDDVLPGLVAGEALGGDICLVNTEQKKHLHAQQLLELITGPKDLST